MGKSKCKPGDVIWAIVQDRNGVEKPEQRPLLVIKPFATTDQQALCCLAISTDPKRDPSDPAIEMPWDASNGSTTGLYKWSRVVLLWRVLVDQNRMFKKSGVVTNTFLANVIEARQAALQYRPA